MNKKKLLLGSLTGAAAIGAAQAYKRRKKVKPVTDGGHTALITGASSGIGKEFAQIFAKHGYDLVLTARSKDKLKKLADDLTLNYDVSVTVIPADLSDETEAKRLYDEIKKRGIEIDQLVNNAGAGHAGDVADTDPETMLKLIHLNISSVTLLCHYFAKDMKDRGQGKILNVSSLGAFIPDPHFNVYGPTKAYELFLSEAMSGELKGTGVTVSCLCPGPTKTNWAKNAGKSDSKTALDPAEVARIGFTGMQKGDLVIVPTALFKTERTLMGLLPATVRVNIIDQWQKRLIKKEND